MASISLRGVCKSFDGNAVLRDIDLEVADGEFVVMVGPSGCGKSTLLKCIAGLEEVTSGELWIGGTLVNDVPPKDRDIAMVFQSYALYPNMTVKRNITFGMEARHVPAREQGEMLQRAVEMLHIAELLERRPAQLSGGQRQRVAMGRAVVRKAAVFLFDEPLSNLDAKLRVQMRAELKALHHRLGQTIVYVTHDQVEAMTLADRIVVMNAGRIEQVGPPLEVYDHPVNQFVAGFIGSPAMNFIPGQATRRESGWTLVARDGAELPMPQCAIEPGQEVVLGARPEHLDIAEGGPVPLKVDIVEPTGDGVHLFGKLGGELVCVSLHERVQVATGDVVRLGWPVEKMQVFDAKDGRNLVRR